jgi:hypothetical protein
MKRTSRSILTAAETAFAVSRAGSMIMIIAIIEEPHAG